MDQKEQAQLREVAEDVAKVAVHGKEVIQALRKEGVSGAIREATEAAEDVRETIRDVTAALPTIKSGLKSTEFWLNVGVIGGITALHALGRPLPISLDVALLSVSTIYTVVRSAVKAKASANY